MRAQCYIDEGVKKKEEKNERMNGFVCPSQPVPFLLPSCAIFRFGVFFSLLQAIFYYEPDMRAQCYIYEGVKKIVQWFSSYLIVVSEEGKEKEQQQQRGGGSSSSIHHVLTIYDLKNKLHKFIAFQVCFFGSVNERMGE